MQERGRLSARGVSRDVEPSTLTDLLERPPRATVALVDHGAVHVVPVRARCRADAYRFGVRPHLAPDVDGRDVVLVLDDGAYWFELRGISVRGRATGTERAPQDPADGLAWYGGPGHLRIVPTTAEILPGP